MGAVLLKEIAPKKVAPTRAMNREVYVQNSAKITVEIQQKRGLTGTKE
jgi:hypothetical protein